MHVQFVWARSMVRAYTPFFYFNIHFSIKKSCSQYSHGIRTFTFSNTNKNYLVTGLFAAIAVYPNSKEARDSLLHLFFFLIDLYQVVTLLDELDDFLKVVDPYVDIILQNQMVSLTILRNCDTLWFCSRLKF